MNEHRINARVDDATYAQLEQLVDATGTSVSHVVREAITLYHARLHAGPKAPTRLLAMAGRARSADARSDVASNVKAFVRQAIEAKHGVTRKP